MNKRFAAIGAGVGAVALAAASMGGISLANAQDDDSKDGRMGHHGPRGEEATGEAAAQATAAAQTEVPDATVERVFVRPDGGYAVGMEKSDDSHIVVLLREDVAINKAGEALTTISIMVSVNAYSNSIGEIPKVKEEKASNAEVDHLEFNSCCTRGRFGL